jgi:release factor glutamine methyltransferase
VFVLNNNIHSFKNYFFKKLELLYDTAEVEQLYFLTFYYFKGWSKVELRMNERLLLSESELLKLNSYVKRLANFEPIQHIFSKAEFFDLKFYVNENVLIPRQETEELVHLILEQSKGQRKNLLDIGTGSGCIPIAIAVHNKAITVSAIEVSQKAISIAKRNAEDNKVNLSLYNCDVLTLENLNSIIPHSLDIIVSNPPYVTIKEKDQMHKNVLEFDPHLALFVEDNTPLIFYDKISNLAYNKLSVGGELYFEINEYYGQETKELVKSLGFTKVFLIKDLNEKDRIIHAIK